MKKKLAFVWDWDEPLGHLAHWEDGLAAALRELKDKWDLKVYTQMWGVKRETIIPHPYFDIYTYPDSKSMEEQVLKDAPDVCLFWADMTRPAIPGIASRIPSAVCFAGGQVEMQNTHLFKKIFVESDSYYEELIQKGYPAIKAFGTNTGLFKPKPQPKIFDVFFPACFAAWKRHDLFASVAKFYNSYACGWFQEHEKFCYEACQEAGVLTTHHTPPYLLPDFYNASRLVLVTSEASGGSQRTVLEALSCNIPVVTMADSDKTSQYVIEAGHPEWVVEPNITAIRQKIDSILAAPPVVNTRDFILKNYSEFQYMEIMHKHLCELV